MKQKIEFAAAYSFHNRTSPEPCLSDAQILSLGLSTRMPHVTTPLPHLALFPPHIQLHSPLLPPNTCPSLLSYLCSCCTTPYHSFPPHYPFLHPPCPPSPQPHNPPVSALAALRLMTPFLPIAPTFTPLSPLPSALYPARTCSCCATVSNSAACLLLMCR